jgi:hypothetical protein
MTYIPGYAASYLAAKAAGDKADREDKLQGYRAPYSAFRKQRAARVDDGIHWSSVTSIVISRAESAGRDVEWWIYLCEVAKEKWRDEFAGLMGYWLKCWRAGLSSEMTNADCRITRTEGDWLRKEVCKYKRLGPPPRTPQGLRPLRKMKSGVASDIIRRRRMNYKQSQTLQPQRVDPFSRDLTPIV